MSPRPSACSGPRRRRALRAREPLGDWLRLGDTRCRVIGVLSPLGVGHGFNADDMVVMPVASAQQLFNSPSVFRILDPGHVARGSAARAAGHHRDYQRAASRRRGRDRDHPGCGCLDVQLDIRRWSHGRARGIAGISLDRCGRADMNVMLVAVTQRTSEIGLLKALGAKRRQISASVPDRGEHSCRSRRALLGIAVGGSAASARCARCFR